MTIEENIKKIKETLTNSCRLIAVTKTHPIAAIEEAYKAGHKVYGENKVQEMVEKHEHLPKDVEWHLIGHLQTNKVKFIAPFVSLIHSVDSFKLLMEINKQGQKAEKVIDCLLQIHIADEETKFGFAPAEARQLLAMDELESFTHITIRGLMGMATLTDNEEKIRSEFRSLKKLFDEFKLLKLKNVEMK